MRRWGGSTPRERGKGDARISAVAGLANRLSEQLLDDYRIPHIAASHLILSAAAWELIADIDLLQANLAGSRVWNCNGEGLALRAGAALAARELAQRAVDLGLIASSERLLGLASVIEAADRSC